MSKFRSGFTLVELLVVIAIIGVLVGLLLPAVQSAREAARRMQCSNNLKQIALSLHNYESTHKKYPPAGIGYTMCTNPPANNENKNANGLVFLLPFMEQGNIYNQFNHSESYSANNTGFSGGPLRNTGRTVGNPITNGNARLAATELPMFLCPSDNNPAKGRLNGSSPHYGPATGFDGAGTNYDFIVHSNDFSDQNNWLTGQGSGINRRMFGVHSASTPGTVSDGLSNTFALGETTKFHVNGAAFAWAYRGWVMVGVDPFHGQSGVNGGINVWNQPWVHPTWQNPPAGTFIPLPGRARSWWCAAASLHPGGAQFAMGDGSVHFVSQTSDMAQNGVIHNLTRSSDGQVASLPN